MVANSTNDQPLAGRVAFVTGAAGSGIGQATARRLAHDGAAVVLTDAHPGRTEKVAAELRAEVSTPVLGLPLDVGDRAAVAEVFNQATNELGLIDILINNAAINQVEPTFELSLEDWDRMIAVDLTGPFQLIRLALPGMIEARRGSIVNVTSTAAYTSPLGESPYAASKAGLHSLTRTIAAEVGEFGIRCNSVAPGLVWTRFLEKYEEQFLPEIPLTPMRRFGQPDDVVGAISFLVSEASGFITGESIVVSGGRYMQP
jgi:NAD(P)-dependent dehydrogenase (short-subunit alcohol dehydrogenase family)